MEAEGGWVHIGGNQAKNAMTKTQTHLTDQHLDITCRTDEVTEGRKKNSFRVMKAARPRPLSAYQPTTTSNTILERSGFIDEKQVSNLTNNAVKGKVFKDRHGRPAVDTELLSNPYNQTSWYKMKSKKKIRPKTAPVPKTKTKPPPDHGAKPPHPKPEHNAEKENETPRPISVKVTRRGSSSQLKTVEVKLEKRISLLYGDQKKGEDKKEAFLTRTDSRRGSMFPESEARRGSMFPESRRGSMRPPKVEDETMSDISDYEDQRAQDMARLKHRRATFKSDPGQLGKIRDKFQNIEEKVYPSKLMNPNPSFAARHYPFPCILDPDRYNEFCVNVALVKTTTDIMKDLDELYNHYKVRRRVPLYAWDNTAPGIAVE